MEEGSYSGRPFSKLVSITSFSNREECALVRRMMEVEHA